MYARKVGRFVRMRADLCRYMPDCYRLLPRLLRAVTIVTGCYLLSGHEKPLRDGAASSGTHVGRLLVPSFLSPGFPSREAMKLRKLSFVNTNFRTRSVHFKAVFIAVSRFKCSLAKVRSNGIATTAMCGCVRMSVFSCGSVTRCGGRPRRKAEHIPWRRRSRDTA